MEEGEKEKKSVLTAHPPFESNEHGKKNYE